jgi:hypothetical protein
MKPGDIVSERSAGVWSLDGVLRRLLPFLCLGVVISLVFSWFGSTGEGRRPAEAFDSLHFSWFWMLVAMLLALLPWAWHCLRLAIWGRFFGVKISWRNLLRIVIATDVGGVVTPTVVGGAPLKWAMLVRHGYPPGQATALTLWGNLEDGLFYLVAIPLSLSLTRNWDNPLVQAAAGFFEKNGNLAVGILLGVAVILLVFSFLYKKNKQRADWSKKLRNVLTECRAAFKNIGKRGHKPFIWSLLALSAQWLTRFCVLLAVVKMLGLEADFFKLLLLQWMMFVAILLTPTPGGAGGAEVAFLLVFAGSLPDGSAGVVMLGWRLLTYYFMLLTGAVLLMCLGSDTGLHRRQNPLPTMLHLTQK